MLYLTVEDIVPNSIIELNKIDGRKEVLIEDAKRYGKEVAEYLKAKGYYTLLKINPSLTESFEEKYGNFFTKYNDQETYGYRLSEEKNINDIIEIFRNPIHEEIRDSFSNQEVISKSFQEIINNKAKKRVLRIQNEKR